MFTLVAAMSEVIAAQFDLQAQCCCRHIFQVVKANGLYDMILAVASYSTTCP